MTKNARIDEVKITRIDEIKDKSSDIVELPGFETGKTFNARLKRLSLLDMALNDEIPNELLGAANSLYTSGLGGMQSLRDTAKIFKHIAKASLVEPSFVQLEKEGVLLTDSQLLAIYLYATGGVKEFITFR